MKKLLSVSFMLLVFYPLRTHAQFVLNGNAAVTTPECSASATTYLLTPNSVWQAGQIWYTTQVSIANRFDIQFQMFLGTKSYSAGADGICFVFQQKSDTAGSAGGGMGFGGITPSLGVEFDSFENYWDPPYCHTAIEKNGDYIHTDNSGNNLAGPIQLDPSNPNLPDGQWHNMEITWDPGTQTISVYYDCIFRLSYTGNVIDSIFGGNPNVYWGFTGGTGDFDNTEEVCITHSYLTSLRDTSICLGAHVSLTASGGVSYKWSTGSTNSTIDVSPAVTTTYYVTITGVCGAFTDSSKVTVIPHAAAIVYPLNDTICPARAITLSAAGNDSNDTYKWNTGATSSSITVNDSVTTSYTVTIFGPCDSIQKPVTVTVIPFPKPVIKGTRIVCKGLNDTLTVSGGNTYLWNNGKTGSAIITGIINNDTTIHVIAENKGGCPVPDSVRIIVRIPPVVSLASTPTICPGQCLTLTAEASDSGNTFSWNTGATTGSITVCPLSTFTYALNVSNGCITKSITTVHVYPSSLFACCDTTIKKGDTALLTAGNSSTYKWTPNTGLNCDTCRNVIAIPTVTTTYTVTGIDSNGCVETRMVTVDMGESCSDFIVPNVFTPNGDGVNDRFVITAAADEYTITIYNRWGVQMYTSTSTSDAWNGNAESGTKASDGVYYYIINATCRGNSYKKNGFVQLIR